LLQGLEIRSSTIGLLTKGLRNNQKNKGAESPGQTGLAGGAILFNGFR
jgi:hypothetical protein